MQATAQRHVGLHEVHDGTGRKQCVGLITDKPDQQEVLMLLGLTLHLPTCSLMQHEATAHYAPTTATAAMCHCMISAQQQSTQPGAYMSLQRSPSTAG